MSKKLHSEQYIDDSRSQWWRYDYLRLICERIGMGHVSSIVDVGAGAGHWITALVEVLEGPLRVHAVDNEMEWLNRLSRRFAKEHQGVVLETHLACASNLPLDNNSVDVATCQTLLLHVSDPQEAISEMVRVVRNGQWVIVAEPVNVINRCHLFDAIRILSPEEQGFLLSLWSTYHECVQDRTGMNYDVALQLPNLMSASGLVNVHCAFNEKIEILDAETASIEIESMIAEYQDVEIRESTHNVITDSEWERGVEIVSKMAVKVKEQGAPLLSMSGLVLGCGQKWPAPIHRS